MSTATEMRDAYTAAELDILQHGQSSRLGERILTAADLPEIRKGRQEWESRARIEAASAVSGGPGLPHSLANITTRST